MSSTGSLISVNAFLFLFFLQCYQSPPSFSSDWLIVVVVGSAWLLLVVVASSAKPNKMSRCLPGFQMMVEGCDGGGSGFDIDYEDGGARKLDGGFTPATRLGTMFLEASCFSVESCEGAKYVDIYIMGFRNREGKIYVWDLQTSLPSVIARLSHAQFKSTIRRTAVSFDGRTFKLKIFKLVSEVEGMFDIECYFQRREDCPSRFSDDQSCLQRIIAKGVGNNLDCANGNRSNMVIEK
ncbi:hypothetical protein M8C21_020436 [Ambrosia artemisiifolia]|uniref:Uncharacterized protein n=1 Tax=Ambrosia artemisiifolia TaxID=4212 RepID=A0AAD5BS44_AMBAR|nr:hypothetical protein M8C21_020436 [Ambrosia artemisiifolia]